MQNLRLLQIIPSAKVSEDGGPKNGKNERAKLFTDFCLAQVFSQENIVPTQKRLICLEQSRKSSLKSNVRRGSKIGPGQGPPSKENKKVGQKR